MLLTARVPSRAVTLMPRTQQEKQKPRSRRWKFPENLNKSTLLQTVQEFSHHRRTSSTHDHLTAQQAAVSTSTGLAAAGSVAEPQWTRWRGSEPKRLLTNEQTHRPRGVRPTVGRLSRVEDQGLEFKFVPCERFNPNIRYSCCTLWWYSQWWKWTFCCLSLLLCLITDSVIN